MKAKKSREELSSVIDDRIRYLQWAIREVELHLNRVDELITDNILYLQQLDDLFKDLDLLELGK